MEKVKYTVDERVFRNDRGELRIGYVTRLVAGEKVDEEKILEKISKATGLGEVKISYILNETANCMMKYLLNGSPVTIPHIGTFRLGLSSEAKVRKTDAGVKAMKMIRINYNPTLKMKKLTDLSNMAFKHVEM